MKSIKSDHPKVGAFPSFKKSSQKPSKIGLCSVAMLSMLASSALSCLNFVGPSPYPVYASTIDQTSQDKLAYDNQSPNATYYGLARESDCQLIQANMTFPYLQTFSGANAPVKIDMTPLTNMLVANANLRPSSFENGSAFIGAVDLGGSGKVKLDIHKNNTGPAIIPTLFFPEYHFTTPLFNFEVPSIIPDGGRLLVSVSKTVDTDLSADPEEKFFSGPNTVVLSYLPDANPGKDHHKLKLTDSTGKQVNLDLLVNKLQPSQASFNPMTETYYKGDEVDKAKVIGSYKDYWGNSHPLTYLGAASSSTKTGRSLDPATGVSWNWKETLSNSRMDAQGNITYTYQIEDQTSADKKPVGVTPTPFAGTRITVTRTVHPYNQVSSLAIGDQKGPLKAGETVKFSNKFSPQKVDKDSASNSFASVSGVNALSGQGLSADKIKANPDGSVTVDTAGLKAGDYRFVVNYLDKYGNAISASDKFSLTESPKVNPKPKASDKAKTATALANSSKSSSKSGKSLPNTGADNKQTQLMAYSGLALILGTLVSLAIIAFRRMSQKNKE
ncbi:hypothetical protein [Lactococcus termiticola]|uniref:Gram-positive cocci surface proteins LPxTG domain-containing protein n=1 Tax=Lactococcus termiticola TaxID=2169526 RepID=A0A2R5HHW7_9LACT|nr:hypothetical protein [Lactococcus termiticola]GBG97506.1 hypothetical protein NtB2_01652 [Lactococcus termiticola]